jgi:hypothetical protein
MPLRPNDDTSPECRRIWIDGLRRMSHSDKLARFLALQRSVEAMALTGLRLRHPEADEAELRIRLARLWLDEPTHRAVVALRSERP